MIKRLTGKMNSSDRSRGCLYLCFSARVMYQSKTAVSGKTLQTLTDNPLPPTGEEDAEEEPGWRRGIAYSLL